MPMLPSTSAQTSTRSSWLMPHSSHQASAVSSTGPKYFPHSGELYIASCSDWAAIRETYFHAILIGRAWHWQDVAYFAVQSKSPSVVVVVCFSFSSAASSTLSHTRKALISVLTGLFAHAPAPGPGCQQWDFRQGWKKHTSTVQVAQYHRLNHWWHIIQLQAHRKTHSLPCTFTQSKHSPISTRTATTLSRTWVGGQSKGCCACVCFFYFLALALLRFTLRRTAGILGNHTAPPSTIEIYFQAWLLSMQTITKVAANLVVLLPTPLLFSPKCRRGDQEGAPARC